MSNIKIFLKTLQKSGYPNTSPDVPTIAKAIDYPIDGFLTDMKNSIGMEGTDDFVEKTFSKLNGYTSGIEVDLSDYVGDSGSYIFLIINGFDILYNEYGDELDEVWIHYSWGPNEFILDGENKTLEEMYDDVDMGDMGEWSDFMDEIQDACIEFIFKKTGFIIHFDSQT